MAHLAGKKGYMSLSQPMATLLEKKLVVAMVELLAQLMVPVRVHKMDVHWVLLTVKMMASTKDNWREEL
jgi:hypothetical protein